MVSNENMKDDKISQLALTTTYLSVASSWLTSAISLLNCSLFTIETFFFKFFLKFMNFFGAPSSCLIFISSLLLNAARNLSDIFAICRNVCTSDLLSLTLMNEWIWKTQKSVTLFFLLLISKFSHFSLSRAFSLFTKLVRDFLLACFLS